LSHPADRRRLASWASEKNIKLNIINPLDSDVLVLSNAANFGYWIHRATQPIYLDLVDGYLGEDPPVVKDFLRNLLRTIQGLSSLKWITYTRHLRYALRNSYGVIVPSQEQSDLVSNLNPNVFIITDDHSELEKIKALSNFSQEESTGRRYLFWEGYGYTLKHFRTIAHDLDVFLAKNNFGLYLVTVDKFKRWGGKLGNIDTRKFIDKMFPYSKEKIVLVPWSLENLVYYSELSCLGIIPIDRNDAFAFHKSENKLLSMWKLGLPVLYSNIPSYKRVALSTHQKKACLTSSEWTDALNYFALSSEELDKLKLTGLEYVRTQNRHDSLVDKWDVVIRQTLM